MLFPLDADELDTELDAIPFRADAFERHERERLREIVRARHDALARAARPTWIGSIALLETALRHVAAFAASERHVELFGKTGLLGPWLAAVYAAAEDAIEGRSFGSERVELERQRLARVQEALPDDVRAAVLETFVAFARFEDDFG